jgi:hypothetical protein
MYSSRPADDPPGATLNTMNTEVLLEYITGNCTPESEHWGIPVFTIDGEEMAIAPTYEEAEEAAKECIKESVWAFNADFLSSHCPLTAEEIDSLRGARCGEANCGLLAILDDFDEFAEDAISSDGLGHFLSPYDGECREIGDFLVFRVN